MWENQNLFGVHQSELHIGDDFEGEYDFDDPSILTMKNLFDWKSNFTCLFEKKHSESLESFRSCKDSHTLLQKWNLDATGKNKYDRLTPSEACWMRVEKKIRKAILHSISKASNVRVEDNVSSLEPESVDHHDENYVEVYVDKEEQSENVLLQIIFEIETIILDVLLLNSFDEKKHILLKSVLEKPVNMDDDCNLTFIFKESPIHRLLVHGIAQFYSLRSKVGTYI